MEMRSILILLAFAGSVRAGLPPELEVVILLQNSRGMEKHLSATQAGIRAGDSFAVLSFSKSTRVEQEFTNDAAKLGRAIEHLGGGRFQLGRAGMKRSPEIRVYDAIGEACRQFRGSPGDGRRRAVVLLFGDDERGSKAAIEDLARALAGARAELHAVAVRKVFQIYDERRTVQTPPTAPGRMPPVATEEAPLPGTTLDALGQVARGTGGEASAGPWNLREILDRIRSRPASGLRREIIKP